MNLTALNVSLKLSQSEFFSMMVDAAARVIERDVRDHIRNGKEYDTILGPKQAGFDCRVHPHDNMVLLLESFVGHDQVAAIDWKAVFAALVQLLHLDADFSESAAEFTQRLQGADVMQKVACYLRLQPKTEPTIE
jgi:hypothetical protein